MIKQMVQWEGFDGQQATRTVYFNLTRFEIAHDMELEVLEERFRRFNDEVISDEKRPLTPPEIREMLDIFKVLIKHAFGVRSQDGKRFVKNEEVWNEFNETGCFDAFIFHMFEDPARANNFMKGIWPQEIQDAAEKIRQERPNVHPVPDLDPMDADTNGLGEIDDMGLTVDPQVAPDDGVPSITSLDEKREDSSDDSEWHYFNYSREHLLNMSTADFDRVMQASRDGSNVPKPLLVIQAQRGNKAGGPTE